MPAKTPKSRSSSESSSDSAAQTTGTSAGQSKNLYLFCGEDSFSAFEKATKWKQKFLEKYGDMNFLVYYGEELTGSEFQTALESYPFLSEKKLIFISDFLKEGSSGDQEKVLELLDQVPEYAVVLFWEHHKPDARTSLYKKLKKIGTLEEFPAKNGVTLVRWIRERFQSKGAAIGETEARWMADLVGDNLWTLSHEIDKTILYAAGRPIDRKMVETVVCPNPSSSIFKLTDFLGEKRLQDSLRTLEILLNSGEEIVGMFFMLVRHFRLMAQVKDLADRGEKPAAMAKIMKESPFVVSKMYSQAKYFHAEDLRKIYTELMAIDSGFKTGRIRISGADDSEMVREMEVFITKICLA